MHYWHGDKESVLVCHNEKLKVCQTHK
jgi:hypothetical protein